MCHHTVWLWLVISLRTARISAASQERLGWVSQAGRRAGGQAGGQAEGESCGGQGCYKEVNPCSGSPAIIKNLKVLLVQMVYPLLHFLHNLSLTWFMKNFLQDCTPSIIKQWMWCTASFMHLLVSVLIVCVTGVNESKSQWSESNIVWDTLWFEM